MDSADLQKIARETRSTREIGIALTIASGVLAVLLFVPLGPALTIPEPRTEGENGGAFKKISLEAKAAIVYDLATKQALYTKNADTQLPLASLTKLLTVYAALSSISPDTLITIPRNATSLEGPHVFSAGQTFSLGDLARLTLTASLNDGAAAIASAVADQENRSHVEMLAGAAAALGLSQTYALNGNGLDVSAAVSGGYGSARDLARLVGALVARAPDIVSASTQPHAQAVSTKGTVFSVKNTNPTIDTIPHLLLSKTGFTDLAGGNLAIVFDAGIAHPIAIVVLGSSQKARFTDSLALVAATLAHFAGVPSP